MIDLPEDPQSDFEFIAVRSHDIILQVVLTTGLCPTCYSLPVPGGTTVCLSEADCVYCV